MPFRSYSMPKFEQESGKWVFRIYDEEERLLEQVEHDSEEAAKRDHKNRFIDDVLNDRVMKEARRERT